MNDVPGDARVDVPVPSKTHPVVSSLARACPWSREPDHEYVRSLGYLGVETDPATVLCATDCGAVLASVGVGVVLAAAAPWLLALVPVVAWALAAAAQQGPVVLATVRRTAALGEAGELIGRMVLRMRVEPTPERAATFAARNGEGPLSQSLAAHVGRAAGTPRTGLTAFGAEWTPWFPALERAVTHVTAAAHAPAADRTSLLERSLDAVLDGTHDQLASFSGEIRGPAAGLYAFGVVLPLALVGVLPAARAGGVDVPLSVLVVGYDFVLPVGLVVAGAWLLLHRPVAFPPPAVAEDREVRTKRQAKATLAGVVAAGGAWAFASELVAAWAGPVGAVGVGTGAWLLVRYAPVKRARDEIRAVEDGLPDALGVVGRAVSAGTSVERALTDGAETIPRETGVVLSEAVGVQRALGVGVSDAFLGEYGVFAESASPRLRSAGAFLGFAATEGRPAGEAVVAMSDQLERLRRVERDARRELAQVTGTLSSTAAFFGPLVAGATVALAASMHRANASVDRPSSTAAVGDALATADLGLVVGAYVLVLAAILPALATGLERGLDRSLVGYRLGLAFPAATGTYLASVVGAGLLV